MEDSVSVGLEHLGVDVEARVPKLGDLLGEQLDAIDRVAEYDRLVNLELRAPKRRMGFNAEHTWDPTREREKKGR